MLSLQAAFGLSALLILNKNLHNNKVEHCKSVGMVMCMCVNMHRFSSCSTRKKVITSCRQKAASASSLMCLSVHVCLTLPVTICFCCLQEGDLRWDYTIRYVLLHVMSLLFSFILWHFFSSICMQPGSVVPIPGIF